MRLLTRQRRLFGLSLAVLAVLSASGCAKRQIRVEMAVTDEGTSRTFASNALAKDDVARLEGIYASTPQPDAATGGARFEGSFGEALPQELGNRNGTSAIRTRLGTTRFYFEAFAEETNEWAALKSRIDGGELWVRLFGRWAERGINDPSKREAWRQYVDGTLVPLSTQLAVMFGSNATTAQALRVAQRVRTDDNRAPVTAEEQFLRRAVIPMLLCAADAGIVTAEESHRLLLVTADANATKAERDYVTEQVIQPAILRVVERFRPDVKSVKNVPWTTLALSFWIWAQTSSERNELLLASPAISDADKDKLRRGETNITLPPPFGVDPLSAPKSTETEVRLVTGERPFMTNGEWDGATKAVLFKHAFVPAARRLSIAAPYFFAAWSEPDVAVQTKLFGSTLLTGESLAEYGMWSESLSATQRLRWETALDLLEREGRADQLRTLRAEFEAKQPLPKALATWIDATSATVRRAVDE